MDDAVALQRLVTKTPVGSRVPLKVMRNGHEKDLNVTVGEQPGEQKVARADEEAKTSPLRAWPSKTPRS